MQTRLLIVICAAFLLNACGGSRPPIVYESNLGSFNYDIAKGPNYSLTMAEVRNRLNETLLLPQGGIVDTFKIRYFADSLITDTLAGLKADQINLEDNFKNYHLYRLRYNDLLMKVYLDEAIYKAASMDSAEVIEMVEKQPELFQVGDNVFVNQIFISPLSLRTSPDSSSYRSMSFDEIKEASRKIAYNIREMITTPDSFAVMADRYSHDIYSKGIGGFIGWTPKGTFLDPFDSIAFSSEIGTITEPYWDQDGWHILWIRDKIPAGVAPLDKLFEYAVSNAQTYRSNQIGSRIMDSLKQAINLVYNDKILDKNIYYVHRNEWAAILNGIDTLRINNMRQLEESYRHRYKVDNTTPEQKKEMLNELSERYIIVQAARAAKMDTLPVVVQAEKDLRHKYKKSEVMLGLFDPNWEPSESHIEYYYQQHLDQFQIEKPITVQQMIIKDSVLGEFIRDQAMAGVDFLDLADQYYQVEPLLRREMANLGRIGPEDVSPEFYSAAQMTTLGEVSHPIRTEFGFQLIRVIDKKPTRSFDDARLQILQILKDEHVEEHKISFGNKLREEFNVRNTGKLYPIHLKPAYERSHDL